MYNIGDKVLITQEGTIEKITMDDFGVHYELRFFIKDGEIYPSNGYAMVNSEITKRGA